MKSRHRLRALIGLIVLAVAGGLLCGCGGGSDDDSGDETTTNAETQPADGEQESSSQPPLAAPEADESIKEAEKRVEKAISSGDCEKIGALGPVGREVPDTFCEGMKTRLGDAEATGAEAYDDGGGVIDYKRGELPITAIMVLDRDGLFHLFYVDQFLGEESAGTKFAGEFDQAANKAVDALADKDCDAFLDVAFRRAGPGASREQACTYAENNPIANVREIDPEAKLERLGGNADYAFYGIGTPAIHFTIVMARQSDENAPPAADKLPKDAAEYGYYAAYATNTKKPQE